MLMATASGNAAYMAAIAEAPNTDVTARIVPTDRSNPPVRAADYAGVAVPLQLVADGGVLAFFSTTTIFGTPVDITLSELALEAFFPADAATAESLRRLAESGA